MIIMGIKKEELISYLSKYFDFTKEELDVVSKLNTSQIPDSKLVEYFYGPVDDLPPTEKKTIERQIRRILMKLEEFGLVKCVRSCENGLVVWKVVESPGVDLSVHVKRKIDELKNKKQRYEHFTIFSCPSCGSEYHFSDAFSLGFICPSCGITLEECKDKKIEEIEQKIKDLESLLNYLSKRVE